jgi:hypothetical protein
MLYLWLMMFLLLVMQQRTSENEMIQRRAARMVYADYQTASSVSTMLNQLQWTTLQERRAQAKACMMYRVVNQLIDIPIYKVRLKHPVDLVSDGGGLDLGLEAVDRGSYDCL